MNETLQKPFFAIVEDEPNLAEFLCSQFAEVQCNAVPFLSGTALLQHQRLSEFTHLVLDLSLPDIDGFNLMDALASAQIQASVVLMSGHDDSILHAAQVYGSGLGLDILATLRKPFSKDDLFIALGLAA